MSYVRVESGKTRKRNVTAACFLCTRKQIALFVYVSILVPVLYGLWAIYTLDARLHPIMLVKNQGRTKNWSCPLATGNNRSAQLLPDCPEEPPNLQGNLNISFTNDTLSFETIATDNPLGGEGGHYKPQFCQARSKVAVIIPYRNREQHFKYFLQFMLPTLRRQQLDFRIYIINQFGSGKFNRAKLMNIGFAEALEDYDFECFVFHDVDLILENDKCLYTCPPSPRHLSVAVDKFKYNANNARFGGVTAMTKCQFLEVNGYPNSFWGWGGEDESICQRIEAVGMKVIKYSVDIARYKMISHERDSANEANPERFKMMELTKQMMREDGLNNLNYTLVSRDLYPTYTNITVDVFAPN